MAELPAAKECPSRCPICGEGEHGGGGRYSCRYSCSAVINRDTGKVIHSCKKNKNQALIDEIGKGE